MIAYHHWNSKTEVVQAHASGPPCMWIQEQYTVARPDKVWQVTLWIALLGKAGCRMHPSYELIGIFPKS